LINDPFSDPGLFVDFRFGRRALLCDLGDLTPLAPREIMRVSHAFVSHAHVDHFCGFDRLLRFCLHREASLHLIGPRDFGDRVAAKLHAYTWNLLDDTSINFLINVDEFDERVLRRSRFAARTAFVRQEAEPPALLPGLVLEEEEFSVEAAVLDHGIPSLAFALQERLRLNVIKEALIALNLPVGPWLNEAKRAVRRGYPDDHLIAIDADRTIPLGKLKGRALRISPGQRVAYVVDAAAHEANIERAAQLSRGADQLFIEAAFASEDAAIARTRHHLTAAAAAEIAKRAGARRVVPFHFSPRYLERPDLVANQVEAALSTRSTLGSSGR
jgi:ribonuclease Z